MSFTNRDDVNLIQASHPAILGAGEGNDRYILDSSLLSPNQNIRISDTKGSNTLHLVGGLEIVSSQVAVNAVMLTLNNGAIVTVLGANTFNYLIGGNPLNGSGAAQQNFSEFVTQSLKATVPATGMANGGGVTVNQNGTTTATGTTPGGGGSLPVNPGSNTVEGTPGDDELQGGPSNETLKGYAGDDVLQGAGGNDLLDGGDGADTLIISTGKDTMNGGAGDDLFVLEFYTETNDSSAADSVVITGGPDADRFIVGSTFLGTIAISDFAVGAGGDVIDVNALLGSFDSSYVSGNPFNTGFLRFEQNGANTVLRWDADGAGSAASWVTVLTLTGVQATAVSLTDNVSFPA